jgi:hypothetical protein
LPGRGVVSIRHCLACSSFVHLGVGFLAALRDSC